MTETYAKLGRGGAGNFYAPSDLQPSSSDLEAQSQSRSASQTSQADLALARTLSSQQPAPEYAHTGRGGAGNWIKPSEHAAPLPTTAADVGQSATSSPASDRAAPHSHQTGGAGAAPLPKPSLRAGRGGAGNFDWGAAAAEEAERQRKEEEGRRAEEDGKKVVEEEVENALAGLTTPGRAVIGDRARRSALR